MAKETHPHIHLFDASKAWKYIIVGTFPPNTGLRTKTYIDYFYGNKGFLWKIIHDLYHDRGYDFFKGSPAEIVQEIKRWQTDYCVALTDTIVECSRKHAMSSQDSDLFDIIYNHSLKEYLLTHKEGIKKIIFTSSLGKNSAFQNFKRIMGEDIHLIQHLLVTNLPSPSGASNITFLNGGNDRTLGLTEDFFKYIQSIRPDLLDIFKERWKLKKLKSSEKNAAIIIPSTPEGLVKEFKLWKYRQVLPDLPCK